MKLCFWQLLVCRYEILVHNPKKIDIASFVPSDKKHLLCHVNPWLLSSTHTTSNLHLISHWLTVQMFHKCSYAVKHENMNFVFCLVPPPQIVRSVKCVETDGWYCQHDRGYLHSPANYLYA
jgi:hypothetical protein